MNDSGIDSWLRGPSNRISCQGVSPVLAQVQRENGFTLLCCILWTCAPWLWLLFLPDSEVLPVRFQLGFDGCCHPSPFQGSHHPPKASGFGAGRVLPGFRSEHKYV